MYQIHSTVRGRHNRLQRMQAPQHGRLKQYVGSDQLRLVRGRPIHITDEYLLANLDHLIAKEKAGILEVRTGDGRKFDLSTLSAAPAVPPPPVMEMVPVPEQYPKGIPMPSQLGGVPQTSLPEYTPEEDEIAAEEVQIPKEFMPDENPAPRGRGRPRK